MKTENFHAGKRIFGEGDFGDQAYRILEGSVEIFVGEGASKVVLAELQAGEVFGEMGMIEQKPRSASARALTAVETEMITREDFSASLEGKGELLIPYLTTIFERLRVTNERLHQALQDLDAQVNPEQAVTSELTPTALVNGPVLQLSPASEEMREQTNVDGQLIEVFPFLLGRRGEVSGVDVFTKNHLLIADQMPYRISRNHCQIERSKDSFLVRDRGSRRGTLVNGTLIGGRAREKTARLHPGENSLILGGSDSASRFKLTIVTG